MTDRYCVMGNPVEHSRSPWIHARFARLTGQDIEYHKRLVPMDGFAAAVRRFRDEGGKGCNITVPFKFEAVRLEAPELHQVRDTFDVVINATATSMTGAASPVPAEVLRRGTVAVDLMYGPAALAFLEWAQQHGAQARDGLGMLVEQAAEAFL